MSQHSSLKIDSVGSKHRNVLKRHERIKSLERQEKWGDRTTVYKLPKVKLLKIKVKKVKAKAEGEAGAGAAGAATPQAQASTAAPAGKAAAKSAAKPAK